MSGQTYWGMDHAYPGETAPRMCDEAGCHLAAVCLLHADSGTRPAPDTTYPGFGRSGPGCGWYIPARYRGASMTPTPERQPRRRQ